jgi:fido (protein-threonine AMPylation protein)
MVTKYDIFELVYRNRHPIKPIEVVKEFKKREEEYDNIHRMLRELTKEDLLTKTKYGFQARRTEKTELLFGFIRYCLSNDVKYNLLLNKDFARFVSMSLQKKEVNSKNSGVNSKTFRKYIDILNRSGLVLVISEKPLRVGVFYNILLNNLLIYFGYEHNVITEKKENYLGEIEKELIRFKTLRGTDESRYRQIVSDFEISFVHHSLALEGNPLTLNETIRILKDQIIPATLRGIDVEEVKNYQRAILQMLDDSGKNIPLTLESVLEYHKMAMGHVPRIAGKIRKGEVYIKGNKEFKITKSKIVKEELEKLFSKYDEFVKRKKVPLGELLSFAVYFHNEFQHIHPFEDGNSRTTRLLTFYLLQTMGIPILDIPLGLLDEYLSYTKGSKRRDDNKLSWNLQKIILWNLKKINERLR